MIYHTKNKRRGKKNIILISVFVLVLVLLFFGSPVKRIFQSINIPVNNSFDFAKAPFIGVFGHIQSKNSLISENEILVKENKELKLELLTNQSLKSENENLKNSLEFKESRPESKTAKVINKPPFSPFDTFVIEFGDKEIFVDNQVYYSNTLIGKVEEVFGKSAVVRLYSSPSIETQISILDKLDTNASGQGSGKFKISIPKDLEISEGEPVFKDGNLFGIIKVININESNTFKDIYFSYPFELNEIDWVLVQ